MISSYACGVRIDTRVKATQVNKITTGKSFALISSSMQTATGDSTTATTTTTTTTTKDSKNNSIIKLQQLEH
jgi:hypothetical protein